MIKALLFFLAAACSICFAEPVVCHQNSLQEEIFANVQISEEGRTYLDPQKIIVTEEGIFFESDTGECTPLPYLLGDSKGCYIASGYNKTKVTKKCPFCDWQIISGAFKCRNPECPSNQPKSE